MTAIVIENHGDTHTVKCKYNPEVVSLIKDTVPSYGRTYDAASKTWSVDCIYVPDLVKALGAHGHFVGDPSLPPAPRQDTGKDFFGTADGFDAKAAAHAVLADIPAEHHGKVFRAIGRILYPDLYLGKDNT